MQKLLIFTEGTTIMHSEAAGHSREEIVRQSADHIPNIKQWSDYIPVGNAPAKVAEWQANGYEISYLTSRRMPQDVTAIRGVLDKYFPAGELFFRQEGESYGQLATRLMPDIIVEDDCESEGDGAHDEITWNQLAPDVQQRIKSVIVPEFGGIDHLPTRL